MERRVSRDDLARAVILVGQRGSHDGYWWVCDSYEIRGEEIVAERTFPRYTGPRGVSDEARYWTAYRPLEEVPDLFLKLASLGDERDFAEAALAFSQRYGLPGGSSSGEVERRDRAKLLDFRNEARRARDILKMYEAALNNDGGMIPFPDWVADRFDAVDWFVEKWEEVLSADELRYPAERFHYAAKRKYKQENDAPASAFKDDLSGFLREAFLLCLWQVEGTVQALCRPVMSYTLPAIHPELKPSEIRRGWRFENLLGAAYLQMYWLMTSGGDLARCEYCGHVISLARPRPGGRKRRSDKRFCDDACRQAHHRRKWGDSGA